MNNSLILTQLTIPEVRDIIRQELQGFFETQKTENHEPADRWMNLTELCEYLPNRPAKQTIYQDETIPRHKRGKHLYFLKSEIDEYLLAGKKFNQADIDSHIDNLISNK
ncbi:MAG: hypothetical protein BGN92_09770 [Sphingobacteriales bacterium 41-5]|nr:MAG: hypothetical protein BGN92_09770 [Sphingobacteriales bacterium 41-5]